MFPKAKLSNDVVVANLGSPHPFKFDDGTVLAAADSKLIEDSKFEYQELEYPGIKGTTDLELTPMMTASAAKLLVEADEDDSIDITIIPRPLMEAMRNSNMNIGKCRCIRLADRVSKVCYHDKFCA